MRILPHAQQSVDWAIARAGIPTASEFDNIISPTWKVRAGEMPRSYLAAKLAERWMGGPLVGFNTFDMDQGQILEEEAIPWLEMELETEVKRVGLCVTDDGTAGCSPDGIIQSGPWKGVEIKCPQPTAHVKALLSGEVPSEYLPQIHGGMWVTGCTSWLFLSYRRGFPKLLVTVDRDDKIQTAIQEALSAFTEQLDSAYARLVEINGGLPKRRPPTPPPVRETELTMPS